MSVTARIKNINKVAKITQFVSDNGNGKEVYLTYSTRTNEPWQIFVERLKPAKNALRVKVQSYPYNHKEQTIQHPYNHPVDRCKTTVSYQALAALKFAAKKSGKVLSFCENYQNAKNLLHFGGKLVKIENLGQGVVWATIRG